MDGFLIILRWISAACAGVSVTCGLLYFFSLMERLKIESQSKDEEMTKRLPLLVNVVLPLTPNVMFIVNSPTMSNFVDKVRNQLMMAGYDLRITPEKFIASRIILGALGALFMGGMFFMANPIPGLLVFSLLLLYPQLWLSMTIRKRHFEIQKSLPTVLDLLTLSVEAGKDFLTALRDILARRRRDALGEELGRTFNEIQLGKQRRLALRDLSRRVQQPDLTAVLNSIIQADELGVSIGQVLRIQGDQLRSKRFQRAEKLANEAPVKILAPVILFIFPPVIIILMGPIFIQALKTLQ